MPRVDVEFPVMNGEILLNFWYLQMEQFCSNKVSILFIPPITRWWPKTKLVIVIGFGSVDHCDSSFGRPVFSEIIRWEIAGTPVSSRGKKKLQKRQFFWLKSCVPWISLKDFIVQNCHLVLYWSREIGFLWIFCLCDWSRQSAEYPPRWRELFVGIKMKKP